MELVSCPKNHFYDAEKYKTCPECARENYIGNTMPLNSTFEDIGKTMPVDYKGESPSDRLGSANTYGATMPQDEEVLGFRPVVGWLVCIDGPEKGKDYSLYTGYNYMGRDSEMQIRILKDQQISRKHHAMVAFDPKSNEYYFGPFGGTNIVYLNDKAVLGALKIEAYDIISAGQSRFMFIPLCGERFVWENA